VSEHQFDDEELLREALEEIAEADVGDYVEEPWGTMALAAAEQIARESDPPPDLVELARAAVERVAADSELLSAVEDDVWQVRIESLRRRLG
jgi:hypothetical protein